MNMNNADWYFSIQHEDRRDSKTIHLREDLLRRNVRTDDARRGSHDFFDRPIDKTGLKRSPKVAIGDDTNQVAVTVGDPGNPKPLCGHLDNRVGERCVIWNQRHRITGVH